MMFISMFTNFSKIEYSHFLGCNVLYNGVHYAGQRHVSQFLLCLSTHSFLLMSFCPCSQAHILYVSASIDSFTQADCTQWNLVLSAQNWRKTHWGPQNEVLISSFQTVFWINWSVNGVTPSQFTQSFSCLLLAQLADWAHLCVVHNTDHITQLLATIGSENMSNVASVLLDFAAPHTPPNLTHWPDGETLKYSLEWWVITIAQGG